MTQDKARKAAVHAYADRHNLAYTQALAALGPNANKTSEEHGSGVLPTVRLGRSQGTDAHSPIAFIGPDGTNRPHACIVGATGTGRTRVMSVLLHQAIQGQATVGVCDPKYTGLSDFISQPPSDTSRIEHPAHLDSFATPLEASTLEPIATLIATVHEQMQRRADNLTHDRQRHETSPYLLVLDEAQMIIDSSNTALQGTSGLRQGILNNIRDILHQGQAVGIHLLIGSQRPIEGLTGAEFADTLVTCTAPGHSTPS